MNKIAVTGRLSKDPTVRYTPSGKVVCQFTLAVQREFKNADGQYEADFIPVVLWSNSAEVAGNNLSKGKKILVEGRLQTRSYVDKQNVTRWVTELVGRHFEYMYSNPSPQQKFDEEFENIPEENRSYTIVAEDLERSEIFDDNDSDIVHNPRRKVLTNGELAEIQAKKEKHKNDYNLN